MIRNLGNTRNSKDDVNTINGNTYIDVARAYYNSTMYDDKKQATNKIYDDVLPVFNAIPKVVNIASALSVSGSIEPLGDDVEYVNNIVTNLAIEQEKAFMARELILGKSILIELQVNPEPPIDDDFSYNMSYYSADEYEVVSVGQDIYYAQIQGIQFVLNDTKDGYEEKEVRKIFIKDIDSGVATSYIEDDEGNRTNEVTYDGGKLPLVEIVTTYDMKQLFYAVDRHNEFEAFIRSILYLAGEPIIAGIGLDKIQRQAEADMSKDRMKRQKTLFTRTENAKLSLLEIQGSSASVMINKQKEIIQNIIKDYPEYSISEVLSGSNVSEETTRIRLTEILSRISELRRNMERGLNKLIGLVAFYDGKTSIKDEYITLGNMVDINIKDVLDTLKIALDCGLISKESAMNNIKKLYNGEDVLVEMEKIKKDREDSVALMQGIVQGGDSDGQGDVSATAEE